MSKLQNKGGKPQIRGKSSNSVSCHSEQRPWVSFCDMTVNSRYNLSNLPQGNEGRAVLLGLYTKLTEMSSKTWTEWLALSKSNGAETMTYGDIRFVANSKAKLSHDTTLFIFRFDTHMGVKKGRIIGYKKSPCAAYHIIGYDIDFSAYDHG